MEVSSVLRRRKVRERANPNVTPGAKNDAYRPMMFSCALPCCLSAVVDFKKKANCKKQLAVGQGHIFRY